MALDPRDVYEFEMSHETGSSKNKLKVTTKFKASLPLHFLPVLRPPPPLATAARRSCAVAAAAPPPQVERKYEPIKVLGHGALCARAAGAAALCAIERARCHALLLALYFRHLQARTAWSSRR
jgi:hypothetical protein